ncbi:hypothetical protein CkaCkLH20_05397 [Colletotrichum karsti]|uniref:Uncharacterized protein n=1 Tax=Colletotrichum karsti TaxID=1095194 RepID=A0A9P6IAS6_9PEZI|nr:uncharacterized protein CkaCkLH20_05397 [Colletotrichum karsti]KAF9877131.1 hypothetical protein CkaCkLH20_05397 [Colletotrichum karsti]
MPFGGPPLGGRDRTAFILSKISHLIGEAVLQAEVRKMPRDWYDAIPQLGDFTYPEFFDRHKGQILDEYLRYYCKFWGDTQPRPAREEDRLASGAGGLRLFNYEEKLAEDAMMCVRHRLPLSSWEKIVDYFIDIGHDHEDLGRHKYFILDCFLAHWADAVSKDLVRMQFFLPNGVVSAHGTRDSVYLVADVDNGEPRISRRHVQNMRLEHRIRNGSIMLECRLLDSAHMGEVVRMTFGVMDAEEAVDLFRDGVCVSSNMEHWGMRRRPIDVEEIEIEEV